MPANLQRHHDERDEEIGDGEVHNEEVDTGATVTVTKERDKDGEVAQAGDTEEHRVGDDRHEAFVVEEHLAWQLERPIADTGRVVTVPVEGDVVAIGVGRLRKYVRLRDTIVRLVMRSCLRQIYLYLVSVATMHYLGVLVSGVSRIS